MPEDPVPQSPNTANNPTPNAASNFAKKIVANKAKKKTASTIFKLFTSKKRVAWSCLGCSTGALIMFFVVGGFMLTVFLIVLLS